LGAGALEPGSQETVGDRGLSQNLEGGNPNKTFELEGFYFCTLNSTF
jgi:hypothetical protein